MRAFRRQGPSFIAAPPLCPRFLYRVQFRLHLPDALLRDGLIGAQCAQLVLQLGDLRMFSVTTRSRRVTVCARRANCVGEMDAPRRDRGA